MSHTQIPLSKLSVWKGNVRKTGAEQGLDELVASITVHGLLNPLTVRPDGKKKGTYEIVAGQRRYLALKKVGQAQGIDPKEYLVNCFVIEKDSDAAEISLAENIVRTQMHPADQFDAFRKLADEGRMSVADIAARFGVSEDTVTKRLKLGRVSPKLLDIYRKGEMSLEQVAALTLTDDHKAQEAAWNKAQHSWQREPRELRAALTNGEIAATDSRVKFIGGVEAYEAAGGKVRRDLFDDRNAGYISDLTLLNDLVVSKLEEVATEVRAEGWKWVEIVPSFDWSAVQKYGTVQPAPVELTVEQQAELAKLSEEYDELAATAEAEDLSDDQNVRLQEVEDAIENLTEQEAYTSEDIARAGCFVSIGYNGSADIRRGHVKSEDMPAVEGKPDAKHKSTDKPVPESDGLPAALVESLTAERTAALRIELANSPHIALAAVVHKLVLATLDSDRTRRFDREFSSCIGISATSQGVEGSKACTALGDLVETWTKQLPESNDELWAWCLDQRQPTLLNLLAVCVAQSVNGIVTKTVNTATKAETAHADALATALSLDMTKWFTPTSENYFSRVSKPKIIEALVEMDGGEPVSPATEKLKKGALAEMAEKSVAATGGKWLPEILRHSVSAEAAEEADLDDAA